MKIRSRIVAVGMTAILLLGGIALALGVLAFSVSAGDPVGRGRSLLLVLILVLGSAGALGLLVFRLARGFEARLAALAAAAAREGTDFSAPTPVPEGPLDEIGVVERAFNRLLENRREVQERLAARERLAEAGRLAAGIAHEMGAPMTEVLSTAHLLIERKSGDPVLLEDLRASAEKARWILSEFLSRARPLPVIPRPIEAAAVVARAVARFRAMNREAPPVRWTPPGGEPVVASADPDRLEEALLNLLRNASESADGEIRVSLSSDPVTIRVSDDGPGVPAPLRARLFEPFVRGSKKGTGLGLWMCRRNLEAMGGRIDLEVSHSERGATFRIRLASVVE